MPTPDSLSLKSEPFSPLAPPSPANSDLSNDNVQFIGNNVSSNHVVMSSISNPAAQPQRVIQVSTINAVPTQARSDTTTVTVVTSPKPGVMLSPTHQPISPPYSPTSVSNVNEKPTIQIINATANNGQFVVKQQPSQQQQQQTVQVQNNQTSFVTLSDLSNVKIPIPKVVKPSKS